ncbi:ribokinase [Sphingobium sp. CR2-8]|uniref:ribokinase n=1 Tax=Sphingobium sp. CR2-8 TaxID=1306534 RepID=UPI002DB9959F|nr:ribokinase [Sphingobium sp. CR2-8]MEC3909802.1 ribokinase [Sphingobium sp. CR2-8]
MAFDIVVLGSLNTDFSFHVATFPTPGETVLADRLSVSAGGKGGNQAVAAARMNKTVAMIAAVGSDDRGTALIDYLAQSGVDVDGIWRREHSPTGLATILVNGAGENLIVVDQGANRTLAPSDFEHRLPVARYALAQFETPLATIAAFLRTARRAGSTCILNAAPAKLDGKRLFPFCDILVINEPELGAYIGSSVSGLTEDQIGDAAKALLSRDDQTVIVTRGRAGVIAIRSGAKLVVSAHQAEAVDTTGAGDCFCGTLVAALSDGLALGAAIERANAAASIAVRKAGAATALPTADEVDEFLASRARVQPHLSH